MRYATFSLPADATLRLGAMLDGRVVDVKQSVDDAPSELLELIRSAPAEWTRVAEALKALPLGVGYPLPDVRLHAPIPRPRKNIVCLGLNYASHARESAAARGRETKIPEVPVFFTKAPT